MAKRRTVAVIVGVIVFFLLPLAIYEHNVVSLDPLSLPSTKMNIYPAFISIWKQYEAAGLLPPSVWNFNNINLFFNLITTVAISYALFTRLGNKSK